MRYHGFKEINTKLLEIIRFKEYNFFTEDILDTIIYRLILLLKYVEICIIKFRCI